MLKTFWRPTHALQCTRWLVFCQKHKWRNVKYSNYELVFATNAAPFKSVTHKAGIYEFVGVQQNPMESRFERSGGSVSSGIAYCITDKYFHTVARAAVGEKCSTTGVDVVTQTCVVRYCAMPLDRLSTPTTHLQRIGKLDTLNFCLSCSVFYACHIFFLVFFFCQLRAFLARAVRAFYAGRTPWKVQWDAWMWLWYFVPI